MERTSCVVAVITLRYINDEGTWSSWKGDKGDFTRRFDKLIVQ